MQRQWYREALRDSLQVAAKTKKVSNIKGGAASRRNNTVAPPSASGPGPRIIEGMDYNGSMAVAVQMPHPPTMTNMPGTSALRHPYPPLTQQHTMPAPWPIPPNNVSGPMVINPDEIYSPFFEPQAPMTGNNAPPFQPSHFFGQGNMGTRDDFDDLASWRDQQGGY